MDLQAALDAIVRDRTPAFHALGLGPYRGEVTVRTERCVYRFEEGAFVSMFYRSEQGRSRAAEAALTGRRLVGFFDPALPGALSVRPRGGCLAALWLPDAPADRAIVLTPRVVEVVGIRRDDDAPLAASDLGSGVRLQRRIRPPTPMHPAPPSATRLITFDPDARLG